MHRIISYIFCLIEEIKGNRFGRDARISLLVNSLVLYLNRLVYDQKHVQAGDIQQELHNAICDFIAEHLEENLSLERLENEKTAGLSVCNP